MIIQNFKFQITSLFFISLYLFLFALPALAENMSSDSYQIQMGNINMGAGMPSSATYKMGLTGGQTAPGLYSSTGYKVMAGFWYIKTIIPFSFTISDLSIDFGNLTAGTPSTLTNVLSVSARGAGGYHVTASESAALRTLTGAATIPDTSCNGGAETCTVTAAKLWTDNTKYGFGFNVAGNDVPTDFSSSNHYRPFGITAQTVMSNTQVGKSRVATVTYKINISASQAAGDYENYIIFIATPSY